MMKKHLRLIAGIVGILFVFANVCLAQNDSLNRQKYWHLRHRLITKFIKVGYGPGESIPANKYITGISYSQKPFRIIRKIMWGDATGQLGYYLGVMATELYLIEAQGIPHDTYYNELIKELYLGLNAINRLDDVAEIIWGYGPRDCDVRIDKVEPVLWDSINNCWLPKPGSHHKPLRNGWCARMDGNVNLLEYFTDASSISTSLVRTWSWKDSVPSNQSGVNFDKYGYYLLDPNDPNFEYRNNGYYPHHQISQDQIFGMLMGLILVNEFVDDKTHYNGIGLKNMAKEIALRLIGCYKGWVIQNPIYPGVAMCNHGGSSFAFWNSLVKIKRYFETGEKKHVCDQILLWGVLDCKTSYPINRGLFALIASIANSTPTADMCKYATRDGFDWGFYFLLRKVIYQPKLHGSCDYTLDEIKNDLNLCPMRGPHYDVFDPGPNLDYVSDKPLFGTTYYQYSNQEILAHRPSQWFYSNRWSYQCTPNDPTQKNFKISSGEFNGLDYLLFYNLACIYYGMDAMGGNYTATRDMYFPEQPIIKK
jgi:hypothetical protein